jgi:hypothetical protein
MQPTYLASSLDGLNSTHPEVRVDDTGASCGIWRADRRGQRIDVRPTVPPGEVASADRLDALRAAVAAAWLDAAGPVTVHGDTTLVAEFALD